MSAAHSLIASLALDSHHPPSSSSSHIRSSYSSELVTTGCPRSESLLHPHGQLYQKGRALASGAHASFSHGLSI
ncbi:hypothetical protein DFH09DRAFT_1334028 [Mycena vulgaris]|nr:hypothetical protein DFH09DRAFT_1334028 [Mycena vulgaris]